MKVEKIVVGSIQANCYVVYDENTKNGFIVDAGEEFDKIKGITKELGIKPSAVLLTHGHLDHVNAAKGFQDEGVPVYIHASDADKLEKSGGLAFFLGTKQNRLIPDVTLSGGETLDIAGFKVKVIHTPGHSAGGVVFAVNDALFTGDTIFKRDYGRYDFRDGDFQTLKNSIINKVFNLKGDYTVYPGHGEPSTLEYERQHNPILIDKGY